jgi:hypothetical protein
LRNLLNGVRLKPDPYFYTNSNLMMSVLESREFILLSSSLPIYQIFFMDLKNLPPAMVSQLVSMVEDYVTSSRKKYAPQAVPLTDAQRTAMQPFLTASTLDAARLCVLHGTRVSNPSMYAMAKMMGIRKLPEFADMAAITFVDVVVSHEEFTDPLLFHELVHVVQYAQLGLKEFAARYVNGFIQGRSYEEIPLEKNAYALEGRFSKNGREAFSVDEEVRQWIKAGKI